MDNKAAKLVSQLISGKRFKTFLIGGKAYTMKSPTIKTMCLAIEEFSQAGLEIRNDIIKDTFSVPSKLHHVLRGLAYLFIANKPNYELLVEDMVSNLEDGTPNEIYLAINGFYEMTSMQEVFQVATSAMKFAEVAAKPK